jgi:hypothetical protein
MKFSPALKCSPAIFGCLLFAVTISLFDVSTAEAQLFRRFQRSNCCPPPPLTCWEPVLSCCESPGLVGRQPPTCTSKKCKYEIDAMGVITITTNKCTGIYGCYCPIPVIASDVHSSSSSPSEYELGCVLNPIATIDPMGMAQSDGRIFHFTVFIQDTNNRNVPLVFFTKTGTDIPTEFETKIKVKIDSKTWFITIQYREDDGGSSFKPGPNGNNAEIAGKATITYQSGTGSVPTMGPHAHRLNQENTYCFRSFEVIIRAPQ